MDTKKELEKLEPKERALLLKAPVLVSLLAASIDGEVTSAEKKDAIKLSHLRTYTSPPILQDYYKEVEGMFEQEFEQQNKMLPDDVDEREQVIKTELQKLDTVLTKLNDEFADKLKRSLNTYKDHVSKAQRNALEYFVLPFDVPGITD